MADRTHDWRTGLLVAYPELFHPHGDPPTAQGWPSVSDGWRDPLERACVRIRAALEAHGGSSHATQVKEKYGTLRLYREGHLSPEADAMVEEAVDLAEARSAVTCEVCGEPGRRYGGRWVTTRCAAHAEGQRPVPAEDGDGIYVSGRVAMSGTAAMTAKPTASSIIPPKTGRREMTGNDLVTRTHIWHPRLFLTMGEDDPSRSFG